MNNNIQNKLLNLQGINVGLQILIQNQKEPNKIALELLEKSRKLLLQLEALIK